MDKKKKYDVIFGRLLWYKRNKTNFPQTMFCYRKIINFSMVTGTPVHHTDPTLIIFL